MSKTVEEQISGFIHDAQESLKAAYCKGYAVAKKEIAAETQEREYKRGLNDAWECAKKIVTDNGLNYEELAEIFGYTSMDTIFGRFSVSEAIAKIKEYEDRQKKIDDEIHVGDEVYSLDSKYKYIVLGFLDNGKIFVLSGRGLTGLFGPEQVHKTGRNYPVKEILKKLNESEEKNV